MLHTGNQAIVWPNPEQQTAASQSLPAIAEDIRRLQGWLERETDILRLSNYAGDWDGMGSDAADPQVAGCALSFLSAMRETQNSEPPTRILLSPSGAFAFEWIDGDKFVRAEIAEPTEVEWTLAIPGNPVQFRTEALSSSASSSVQRQEWKLAPIGPSGSEENRGHEWQPAPTLAVDEPDYVSAH